MRRPRARGVEAQPRPPVRAEREGVEIGALALDGLLDAEHVTRAQRHAEPGAGGHDRVEPRGGVGGRGRPAGRARPGAGRVGRAGDVVAQRGAEQAREGVRRAVGRQHLGDHPELLVVEPQVDAHAPRIAPGRAHAAAAARAPSAAAVRSWGLARW